MIEGVLVVDLVMLLCFFFFFQAEDGIRDIGVTGVQTCALPIFMGSGIAEVAARAGFGVRVVEPDEEGLERARRAIGRSVARGVAAGKLDEEERSEERRGGEEGRSRGSPDHLKKKTNGRKACE